MGYAVYIRNFGVCGGPIEAKGDLKRQQDHRDSTTSY